MEGRIGWRKLAVEVHSTFHTSHGGIEDIEAWLPENRCS